MKIIENRSYFDTLDDEVGQLVKKIDNQAKQVAYRASKKSVFKAFRKRRGVMFEFRKERMSLEHTNDSVLIKIGQGKRGHLAAFRGSWVRIVWWSIRGFSMHCLVTKVKMSKKSEALLVPRGPYTHEEFYAGIHLSCPINRVCVENLWLLRTSKGSWVSEVPTTAALQNLESDEIPAGTIYNSFDEIDGSGSRCTLFIKHAEKWLRLEYVTQADLNVFDYDTLPVGMSVHFADEIGRAAWKTRTTDGWA